MDQVSSKLPRESQCLLKNGRMGTGSIQIRGECNHLGLGASGSLLGSLSTTLLNVELLCVAGRISLGLLLGVLSLVEVRLQLRVFLCELDHLLSELDIGAGKRQSPSWNEWLEW